MTTLDLSEQDLTRDEVAHKLRDAQAECERTGSSSIDDLAVSPLTLMRIKDAADGLGHITDGGVAALNPSATFFGVPIRAA